VVAGANFYFVQPERFGLACFLMVSWICFSRNKQHLLERYSKKGLSTHTVLSYKVSSASLILYSVTCDYAELDAISVFINIENFYGDT